MSVVSAPIAGRSATIHAVSSIIPLETTIHLGKCNAHRSQNHGRQCQSRLLNCEKAMRQICLPPAPLLLVVASVGWIVSVPLAQDAARGASSMAAEAQEKQEPDPILRINAGGHTGGVRSLAFTRDSKRLCSAGLDKVVQVWNLEAVTRDLRGIYLREGTIRWQVARSLRGSIYATASSPTDDLLAFGGYGAMGRLGEILLVNPIDGTLIRRRTSM